MGNDFTDNNNNNNNNNNNEIRINSSKNEKNWVFLDCFFGFLKRPFQCQRIQKGQYFIFRNSVVIR
jgi:hypothetical protein